MKRRNKILKTQASDPPKEDEAKRKLQSPTPERIQRRTYEISQARGGEPGHELDDWLQAERELKAGLDQSSARAAGETSQPTPPQA